MNRVQEIVNIVGSFKSVYFSYFYNNPDLKYFRVVIQVYEDARLQDFDGVYDDYYDLLEDLEMYYYRLCDAEKLLKRNDALNKIIFYIHLAWHTLEAATVLLGLLFMFYMLRSSGVWEEIMGLF